MWKHLQDKALGLVTRIAHGKAPEGAPSSLDEIALKRLDGSEFAVSELHDKVVLFVNVASRCGLTPQYETLVTLHDRFAKEGFTVVGVPCNQFLGQEPGSAEEIAQFCSVTYGVDFPLLEKQDVNGSNRSPLYQWLIANSGDSADIHWNFEKFLLGRDGQVVARFGPKTVPDAPEVVAAVEGALSKKS